MPKKVTVPKSEQYDSANNLFYNIPEQILTLEHSLVSISKWESKHCKPFLGKSPKSNDEIIDYIRCMTLTQNVDPLVYNGITQSIVDDIFDYIDEPMTATTFPKDKGSPNREIITAEIIYYWMIELRIPFECQKWHLNRLLALIKVCSIKNTPSKKMSRRELMSRNRALNASRRKALNSRG